MIESSAKTAYRSCTPRPKTLIQALPNRSEIMVGPVNLCLWYAQYHRIPNPIMNAHKTELQFIFPLVTGIAMGKNEKVEVMMIHSRAKMLTGRPKRPIFHGPRPKGTPLRRRYATMDIGMK